MAGLAGNSHVETCAPRILLGRAAGSRPDSISKPAPGTSWLAAVTVWIRSLLALHTYDLPKYVEASRRGEVKNIFKNDNNDTKQSFVSGHLVN
ncbi:hypothetical protein ACJ73_03717 [Blastomyces percursus]|uniref:Uncharacterized protein n=1 Tax=Blastomyces percursus TaxID=1658174 RepID=A0A1J9QXF6_9EURO|nr:hypothetical protein ACJ73_03717 [Blastomyces percursus]